MRRLAIGLFIGLVISVAIGAGVWALSAGIDFKTGESNTALSRFCDWLYESPIGSGIRESVWVFPAVEAVHIVALAVLLGGILMLDLRLFGVTLRTKSVRKLASDLAPFTQVSLIIILVTGFLLFASEAMKCYTSAPFQVKMTFLFAALLFHFTAYARVTKADAANTTPAWGKLAAFVSIVLWLGVGLGGRAIGFL